MEPEQKKAALKQIIADYNTQYGTNHSINEFDLYYQDVQKRIKDQQYPNQDLAHDQKIDVVLIEPNEAFVSCPMSNLVLGGNRTMADITTPYTGLSRNHGVRVVRDVRAVPELLAEDFALPPWEKRTG